MNFILVAIVVLVIIVISLVIYNVQLSKRITKFKNINETVNNLKVLQDFMDTIGKDDSVENKIHTINDVILEKFNIKYSTIVVFDGAEYIIKASNVDERHWDTLRNLHTDEMFKDSIMTATPKYVTINKPDEKLSYQKSELGRAKSAMFFPLYIDNIYIGYWIIESGEAHAFDSTDTSILAVVKDNIVSVLKTVTYQTTIENIYRIDKTTGINSAEYLYGKGKRTIDKYDQSTICMFTITNIEEINKRCGRNIGTKAIVDISNLVKQSISSTYVFVRYMGPKFAIAFSGVDLEGVEEFVKILKKDIENIKIEVEVRTSRVKKDAKRVIQMSPITNFVMATYYKGTGIEEVTKKLEEYLDDAQKEESNINCI